MTISEPSSARWMVSSSLGLKGTGATVPRSPMTLRCRHSMSSPRQGTTTCTPCPAAVERGWHGGSIHCGQCHGMRGRFTLQEGGELARKTTPILASRLTQQARHVAADKAIRAEYGGAQARVRRAHELANRTNATLRGKGRGRNADGGSETGSAQILRSLSLEIGSSRSTHRRHGRRSGRRSRAGPREDPLKGGAVPQSTSHRSHAQRRVFCGEDGCERSSDSSGSRVSTVETRRPGPTPLASHTPEMEWNVTTPSSPPHPKPGPAHSAESCVCSTVMTAFDTSGCPVLTATLKAPLAASGMIMARQGTEI
jgi:hypothetical protein